MIALLGYDFHNCSVWLFQMVNLCPGMNEEVGLLMTKYTIGHILCCRCGTQIVPNGANMCVKCLRSESEPTKRLPLRINIIHCPDCQSYFQPPTTWVKAPLESKELLAVCLKKVKKLSEFRLVNAEFICTDPNSKRIQVKVKVQREVLDGVFVEEQHTIEYVVFCQNCTSCSPNDPNQWEAVVQVRQHVSHMRTFYYLEQVIRKHQAHIGATKIKPINQGIDFFFAKKSDATKFYDFLGRVVPIKQARFHKELVSQDIKSNICRYRFNIAATICPICHDDLIYLPPKLSSSLGYLGPLVICTKVRNTITLLNPFTLQKYVLRRDQYWRAPFESILSSMQLVEYIVLDVEIDFCRAKKGHKKYAPAEVQIARVSDFGRNDTIFCVKTHLGHLLKPGDCALGYDLHGANLDTEVEKYKASLPDAVLIKKKYGSKQQNKSRKKGSSLKLGSQNMEIDSTCEEETTDSEYQQFLRDSAVNPELRFNISLHHDDMIPASELEDVFADLDLSDGEGAI